MVNKYLYCVPLLFLSSCVLTTDRGTPPENLKSILAQNLVLLPDSQFENLPPSLKEKEIIFLGEQHRTKGLIQASNRLAGYLTTYKPVVYAMESCYGAHVFLEAASLGQSYINPKLMLGEIQEFNSKLPENRKILMTAVDIEHSIYNNKKETEQFLQILANRCTSDVARRIIQKEIPQLTTQDTFDKMNRYLKGLKKLFLQYFDTFSPEDQDEILFSFDLLQASNRYQYICHGNKRDWQNPHDIRYRYFKKTIERAYRKAQKRKAILLCRVGAAHICLDRRTEARYFARDYSLTKGKVASVSLVPLYYDTTKVDDADPEKHSDIDSIVKMLMKDYDYSYLSLSELQKGTDNSFRWSKYYSSSRPKYDGLLFVRIKKNQDKAD